jgi:hypothetical protein
MLARWWAGRGDDAILLARIQAELALANGAARRPWRRSAASKPWPAPLETDLLLLEAQADFMSVVPSTASTHSSSAAVLGRGRT